MRILILLTILIVLTSCENAQIMDDVIGERPPRSVYDDLPEITISPNLETGMYRMNIDRFSESNSHLESVYIQKWGALLVLNILRINFNPQPRMHTTDNQDVIRSGEKIVVEITGPAKTTTKKYDSTIHHVIEYEGVAIVNLTRPHIVFEASPLNGPDADNGARDNGQEEKPSEDNGARDNGQEEKPSEDNGARDNGQEEKPSEDNGARDNGQEEKPSEDNGARDNGQEEKPSEDNGARDNGQEEGREEDIKDIPGYDTLNEAQIEALRKFRKGDKVIVRRGVDVGLLILNNPNGSRSGGMFPGETGTIISDPKIAGKLAWFEIRWDAPVKDPRSGCGENKTLCEGWSAAVARNDFKLLDKQ